jgi:hypothetical protein
MNTPTIAEILRNGFGRFVELAGKQPLHHLKVAHAITTCRTPTLGGQRQRCDHCGHEKNHYHSCRNRHCPQCQTAQRLAWVNDRLQELLPVGYFHVVFTIPHLLNPFALRNKELFYNLMFRAVKETLLELAADTKRLGADIGFVTVLHTWGQNLSDHPHLHCIVPGGGYDPQGKRWKACQNGFLFPIAVMRKLYRGKLMALFTEAVKDGSLGLHGSLQPYSDPPLLKGLIDQLYATEWVVYAKAPFASAKALVSYLGQYTHRVAIGNRRIVAADHNTVTFRYRDYADNNSRKLMTVTTVEFIRRFMLHVLPAGFRRIRYYGFLACAARKKRFARCREFFRIAKPETKKGARTCVQIIKELTGFDPLKCPVCKVGTLITIALVPKLPPGMAPA